MKQIEKTNKKTFTQPVIKLIAIESASILATSGTGGNTGPTPSLYSQPSVYHHSLD